MYLSLQHEIDLIVRVNKYIQSTSSTKLHSLTKHCTFYLSFQDKDIETQAIIFTDD